MRHQLYIHSNSKIICACSFCQRKQLIAQENILMDFIFSHYQVMRTSQPLHYFLAINLQISFARTNGFGKTRLCCHRWLTQYMAIAANTQFSSVAFPTIYSYHMPRLNSQFTFIWSHLLPCVFLFGVCGFIGFHPAHSAAFQYIKSHLVSGVLAHSIGPLFLCMSVLYS